MAVQLTSYWEGGYRCRVPIRGFEVVVDEPPEAGGTDRGPMPTELLLASLASCFTAAIAHAARKRNVRIPDLRVSVDAAYEGLRIARIKLSVTSSLDRPLLEMLTERARSYCFVSNTLLNTPALEVAITD
jgi:putative redox protein